MLSRLASRSSLVSSVIVAVIGALALVVALVTTTTTPAPAKRSSISSSVGSSIPSIGRCSDRPVVNADCTAWIPRPVASPTRVCSEAERITLRKKVRELGITHETNAFEAATRIARIPVWCRAELPEASQWLARGTVVAMARKDFPAAEQLAALALVYGDQFVDSARVVRKALDRERKKICQARRDSRIAQ
jgi:hypothetical protein